jgi:hypothetical protein
LKDQLHGVERMSAAQLKGSVKDLSEIRRPIWDLINSEPLDFYFKDPEAMTLHFDFLSLT